MKIKSKELAKNTIIIFIGKFCTQFVSFLLIPLYTKYLITSDYGYVDLIQTYLTLIVPIVILRMDISVFRFLIDERNNEDNKTKIITTTLVMLLLQIVIFIALFYMINLYFNINYGIYIVINVIFMALSNVFMQISRGIGDVIGYSISSIICAIITIFSNIFLIVGLKRDASSILISSALGNAFCSIYLIVRNKLYKFIKRNLFDKKLLKKMLKISLPMIPDGLSWWVVNVSDRTIISFFKGTTYSGIYAISCKFSNILSSLFQIFNITWQESASLHIDDKDRDEFFSNVLNTTFRIFSIISLLIIICLPYVYDLIVGKDYKTSYLYIPILLLGNIFFAVANVVGAVYIAKKDTKHIAKTTIMAAIINVIVNVIFINKLGLWSATISTLVSYIILAIYRLIDVDKYVHFKINYKFFLSVLLIYIVSLALYYINNFIGNIINLILVITYAFVINKNYINIIMVKIRKLIKGNE